MNRKREIKIEYPMGISQKHKTLKELVIAVIYSAGLNNMSASLERSPSLLSRQCNLDPDDAKHLRLSDLELIIKETGDHRPIFWLIEKFLETNDSRQELLIEKLSVLLPQLESIVKEIS